MKKAEIEKQEAIARLHEWIKPGDTVYTILDRVSASGMSRQVRVVLLSCDGKNEIAPLHPNYAVGRALGLRHGKRNGRELDSLTMQGCGTDVGFELVYNLGRVLYPAGFGCIGEKCNSNDHSNGDRDRTPHGICRDCRESTHTPTPGHEYEHWHSDGGYALNHRWL